MVVGEFALLEVVVAGVLLLLELLEVVPFALEGHFRCGLVVLATDLASVLVHEGKGG